MRNLYLNNRFFFALSAAAALFVFAFVYSWLMPVAQVFLSLIIVAAAWDIYLLFSKKQGVSAQRVLPEKLSNGDDNAVKLELRSAYPFSVSAGVVDELPYQLQRRDFLIQKDLPPRGRIVLQYSVKPTQRGEYQFGSLNLFVKSRIALVSRRFKFSKDAALPCYPSFVHLRKYELMALQNEFLAGGTKKLRKAGYTSEFEQIKDYIPGDDIRTINWKATSKRNQLMVNRYQEEKAQRIYLIIDIGRTMQMPFGGMTLLDYSINAAMALSYIALRKSDRAGVMSFSKKTGNRVAADSRPGQLAKISEALYNIQTDFWESDFGRLYQDLKGNLSQRSLLLLFSNFETLDALKRQMKYLRAIAKNHLLVVVFFKNSEIQDMIRSRPENLQQIYDGIIAEKFEFEKKLIVQELQKYGILTVYTEPEKLSMAVINKYLEVKARGIL